MSSIVVKKNAPGWPAMVGTAPKKKNNELPGFQITSAASSLWIQKNFGDKQTGSSVESKVLNSSKRFNNRKESGICICTSEKFAPKIVRQCLECQMLYSNFHSCSKSRDEEPIWSEKVRS
jgi:hypothetical protein